MANAISRGDTATQPRLSGKEIAFYRVQLPVAIDAKLEAHPEILKQSRYRLLMEQTIVDP